jgi:prevent-host-death family protein
MHVPVSDAKGILTDLVRRAERGEDIILTRHGHGVVRLVAVMRQPSPTVRLAILNAVRAAGREKAASGPSADRSQDFLYDDNGLPV